MKAWEADLRLGLCLPKDIRRARNDRETWLKIFERTDATRSTCMGVEEPRTPSLVVSIPPFTDSYLDFSQASHCYGVKISKKNPRLIKRFYPMIRPDSFQWRHRAGKRGVPHPIQETSSNAGENNQKEDSDAGTIWVDRCSWWSAHEVGSMGI